MHYDTPDPIVVVVGMAIVTNAFARAIMAGKPSRRLITYCSYSTEGMAPDPNSEAKLRHA